MSAATTPALKLSQAMREGAKKRPQGFHCFFPDSNSSCALGAAVEAALPDENIDRLTSGCFDLVGLFPVLSENDYQPVNCPHCDFRNSVYGVITHLNDDHRIEREEIADWLEGQGL